jgi:hypothetical protein
VKIAVSLNDISAVLRERTALLACLSNMLVN